MLRRLPNSPGGVDSVVAKVAPSCSHSREERVIDVSDLASSAVANIFAAQIATIANRSCSVVDIEGT